MTKKIMSAGVCILFLCMLHSSLTSGNIDIPQANLIEISKGEFKTINLAGSPERIDIGTRGIIDSFMQDDETMIIKGISKGFTSILVLYDSGKIDQFGVTVVGAGSAFINGLAEQMSVNLAPIKSLEVTTAGDKVIITGTINDEKYEDYYKKVVSLYSDYIVNMVTTPKGNVQVETPESMDRDKAEPVKIIQIDVKVVQIRDVDNTQLGIKWFAQGPWQLGAQSGSSFTVERQKGTNKDKLGEDDYTDTRTKTGDSWDRTETITKSYSASKEVPKVSSETLTYSPNINLTNVNFELIALAEEGKIKLLATPKLIVQSGKTASFLVGGEIPIAQSTGFVASVDWKEYGTTLVISPEVVDEENIFINLEANLSELDWSNQVGNYPALITKNAETRLTARDGETFAIAGLTSQDYVDGVAKVPVLGDIPLLGFLFKTKTKRIVNNETIIFFTPHILEPDEMYVKFAEPAGIQPSPNAEKYIEDMERKKAAKAVPKDKSLPQDAGNKEANTNVQKLEKRDVKARRFPERR